MITFKKALLLIIPALLLSCEENFSPKTEIKDTYIVTSVLGTNGEVNSLAVSVTVTRVYDVDGYNPYTNETDPFVHDADVYFTLRGKDYSAVLVSQPRDTVISRYKTREFYYQAIFPAPLPTEQVKLTVITPENKNLSAVTRMPRRSYFELSYPFNSGITTNINRFNWGDEWRITWNTESGSIYFPTLVLHYLQEIDGNTLNKYIQVPLHIANKDNRRNWINPGHTYDGSVEFNYANIDSVMSRISEGVEDKSTITVQEFILNVTSFDPNLSNYYSSTNGYLDELTVRLDQNIYSNITGGIGILGSYWESAQTFNIEKVYGASFGYKVQ